MSKKVLVKFKRPWAAYSRNDIAGFDPNTADALVEGNVADPYDAASERVEAKDDDVTPPTKEGNKKGAGDKTAGKK